MIENPRHQHLNDTWEWIKANPKLHDQGTWAAMTACGTVACLAGWGVIRANGALNYTRGPDGIIANTVVLSSLPPEVREEIRQQLAYVAAYEDYDDVSVYTAAKFLFGVSGTEASAMFDALATTEMLDAMVGAVVSGADFPYGLG